MNHQKSSITGQLKGGSLRATATASRPSSTVSYPASTSRSGVSQTHLIMFGTFVVALALSVAHHFFLNALDGKRVDKSGLTQTWVRDIGNALAGMTGFLLQVSVGVALTQSIWLYIRGNRVTLNNLDILFSLPSLSDLPSNLFKSSVLYVLLLAAVIQALSLVSVFAPNALSVIPAHSIKSNLSVPVPSLDRISGTVSSRLKSVDGTYYRYIGPSPRFQRLARGVLDGNTILPWAPPEGCGRECDYHLNYSGPALRCSTISKSSIDLLPVNSSLSSDLHATLDPEVHVSDPSYFLAATSVYNATSTFLNGTALTGWQSNSTDWTGSDNRSLDLDVVYASNQFGLPWQANTSLNRYDMVGHHCEFWNASYTASVNHSDGSPTTAVQIVDYIAPLDTTLGAPVLAPKSASDGSDANLTSAYAALSLVGAMSEYIQGTIDFDPASQNFKFLELAPTYTGVLNSIVTTYGDFSGGISTLNLSLANDTGYTDMGSLLEQACTNLTASLMSDAATPRPTRNVIATSKPDYNVYKYHALRLWLAYGIALAASLLADVYGLVCVYQNGGAMQRSFSSIAASVRNRDLDALLSEPGEPSPNRAQKTELRYRTGGIVRGERAGFAIAEDHNGEDVELGETTGLTSDSDSEAHF